MTMLERAFPIGQPQIVFDDARTEHAPEAARKWWPALKQPVLRLLGFLGRLAEAAGPLS
jgi:hypothetical protein